MPNHKKPLEIWWKYPLSPLDAVFFNPQRFHFQHLHQPAPKHSLSTRWLRIWDSIWTKRWICKQNRDVLIVDFNTSQTHRRKLKSKSIQRFLDPIWRNRLSLFLSVFLAFSHIKRPGCGKNPNISRSASNRWREQFHHHLWVSRTPEKTAPRINWHQRMSMFPEKGKGM